MSLCTYLPTKKNIACFFFFFFLFSCINVFQNNKISSLETTGCSILEGISKIIQPALIARSSSKLSSVHTSISWQQHIGGGSLDRQGGSLYVVPFSARRGHAIPTENSSLFRNFHVHVRPNCQMTCARVGESRKAASCSSLFHDELSFDQVSMKHDEPDQSLEMHVDMQQIYILFRL